MDGREKSLRMSIIRGMALALVAASVAAPAMAAKPSGIGITSLVVRDVEGKSEEEIRRLSLQDSVYQNEIVKTGLESASELKFADETRISVGPNSSIVLDEFVYDPDPGEGTFALKVTEGVFRFFSGNMASSNYKIETPTVTVGVRGTVLVMVTRGDGAVAVIMESDDGVEVTNRAGDMVLLDKPGKATVTFANGDMTPPGDPPSWALWRIREMDNVLATAGLPVPPPPAGAPESTETQTAAAPPPSPPPPPLPSQVEPEPVEEPVEEDPMRGQPRAEVASGKVPPGGTNANDIAKLPDPPGHDSDISGADSGSNGTGKGNGNAGGNGNGNGNSSGNGNGNGKS